MPDDLPVEDTNATLVAAEAAPIVELSPAPVDTPDPFLAAW